MADQEYMQYFDFGCGILDFSRTTWEQARRVADKFALPRPQSASVKEYTAFTAHGLEKCMEQQELHPKTNPNRRAADDACETPLVRQILVVLQFESHRTSVSKVFRSACYDGRPPQSVITACKYRFCGSLLRQTRYLLPWRSTVFAFYRS